MYIYQLQKGLIVSSSSSSVTSVASDVEDVVLISWLKALEGYVQIKAKCWIKDLYKS